MFGFGKKSEPSGQSKAKKKPIAVEFDPNVAAKVHVMPQRFYVVPKKSNFGLIVIIILAAVVFGSVGLGAYFFFSHQAPLPVTPTDVNQSDIPSQPINVNLNLNTNTNVNTNGAINLNLATSTAPVNTNADQNANINIDLNVNTNTNTDISTPPQSAPDADGDKLTSAEEILFGTNPNNPDSDNDSYSDGNEIINGFDPTRAQLTLAESGLFKIYAAGSYSIIYPTDWQVKTAGSDVIFQANTGEFVQVVRVSNTEKLSLSQWYEQQFPASVALVTAVKINDLNGLRSPDRLNYYLAGSANPGFIYTLTYNVGNRDQANFVTTFNVMVSNFNLP